MKYTVVNAYVNERWSTGHEPVEFATKKAATTYRDKEVARLGRKGIQLDADESKVVTVAYAKRLEKEME